MPSKVLELGECDNLVVVSDVHMRTPDDDRTRKFCGFLDKIGKEIKCDVLVLLGDIFDFINARQRFYYRMWREVMKRFELLDSRGVKVVFVEGNHDYGFEHSPCPEIKNCFFECGDFVIKTDHSNLGQVVLLHSDDVVCPEGYRAFRSVVKSNGFQAMLSPVPGMLTSAFFSTYARLSRSRDDYRELDSRFLTTCVDRFVEDLSQQPSICVLGHIHVHLDDYLRDIRFLSGPAWFDAPSWLSLSEVGQIERHWLDGDVPNVKKIRFSGPGIEKPEDI
ncbi:MAG: metallophosphoesterase [Silvanigrellaceae bacterium]